MTPKQPHKGGKNCKYCNDEFAESIALSDLGMASVMPLCTHSPLTVIK